MSTEQQFDNGEVVTAIQGLMTTHAASLGESTVQGVSHYLEHDEYEMALEGLCIDLMDNSVVGVDWQRCIALATLLGLDKGTILDGDFWGRLNRHV